MLCLTILKCCKCDYTFLEGTGLTELFLGHEEKKMAKDFPSQHLNIRLQGLFFPLTVPVVWYISPFILPITILFEPLQQSWFED